MRSNITKLPLILGSASKSRRFVMHSAGYEFEVLVADIDEKSIRYKDPEALVLAIAKAKAVALLPKINNPSLLVTCDTVVVCGGEILEKPTSYDEMRHFLLLYNQYLAATFSALVVTNTKTLKQIAKADICTIYLNHFSTSDIDDYMANKSIFSWAGGLRALFLNEGSFAQSGHAIPQKIKYVPHLVSSRFLQNAVS